jgi:hypothetical protein
MAWQATERATYDNPVRSSPTDTFTATAPFSVSGNRLYVLVVWVTDPDVTISSATYDGSGLS